MKKIFAIFSVLVIFTLVLAGCPAEADNGDANSDVIGVWKNADGSIQLDITAGRWIYMAGSLSYNGKWSRDGNTLKFLEYDNNFNFGTALLTTEGKLLLKGSGIRIDSDRTIELTKNKPDASSGKDSTTLKINNQSSYVLGSIKWQDVTVATSLDQSSTKTAKVSEGSGYIYFTITGNNIACRTQEIMAVSDGETKEFVFTNNTVVVNINDTVNSLSLGTMATRKTQLTIKNESSYVLGSIKWQNATVTSLAPSSSTTMVSKGSGYIYFTITSNNITYRTQEIVAISDGETIEFVFTNNTVVVNIDDTEDSQSLGTMATRKTQLTIKNESGTEITNVIWQNVSFVNNQLENSIKSGTSVTQAVIENIGYVFFKRKTNPITARTHDPVSIAKFESKTFTFTDSTMIVEVNNTANTGTLGSVASTVVWFDDAEGEMQPYTERQNFVGYYAGNSDVLRSSYTYIQQPKNGTKSIAIGGTSTAKLLLTVNLTKPAKLSFWYANKRNSGSSGNTIFSINNAVQRTWSTDIDWSQLTFNLQPGQNDLVWEKKDGYYYSSYPSYYSYCYYLSLDDILIYYTE